MRIARSLRSAPTQTLLLVLSIGALSSSAAAERPRRARVIVDGRRDGDDPAPIPADEAKRLAAQIEPLARAAWGRDLPCDLPVSGPGDITIVARAEGAFTRPEAREVAVLYRLCELGRQDAVSGLAIVARDEAPPGASSGLGEVRAHVAYERRDLDLVAVGDLDGDGRDELGALWSESGQGESATALTVLAPDGRGVRALGTVRVADSDCGERQRDGDRAWVLRATPGRPGRGLALSATPYARRCDDDAPWRPRGTVRRAVAARDETAYRGPR